MLYYTTLLPIHASRKELKRALARDTAAQGQAARTDDRASQDWLSLMAWLGAAAACEQLTR